MSGIFRLHVGDVIVDPILTSSLALRGSKLILPHNIMSVKHLVNREQRNLPHSQEHLQNIHQHRDLRKQGCRRNPVITYGKMMSPHSTRLFTPLIPANTHVK